MPFHPDQKAIVHVVDDDPSIREALQDLFHPVQSVLARIEDEIYTKGAIG